MVCRTRRRRASERRLGLNASAVAAISHEEHFEGHALTAEVRLQRVAELQA